jgi:hypothetical protein
MNSKKLAGVAGCVCAMMVNALAEDAGAKNSSAAKPVEKAAANAPAAPDAVPPTRKTATETLQDLGAVTPRYPAHPPATKAGAPGKVTAAKLANITMPTPPPAPRPEKKPTAPTGNFVWVPGHYVPLKDEWHWVAGEWGVPATPSSVWIESTYDPKTKSWSPGYWQPDRADADDPSASPKTSPNGY